MISTLKSRKLGFPWSKYKLKGESKQADLWLQDWILWYWWWPVQNYSPKQKFCISAFIPLKDSWLIHWLSISLDYSFKVRFQANYVGQQNIFLEKRKSVFYNAGHAGADPTQPKTRNNNKPRHLGRYGLSNLDVCALKMEDYVSFLWASKKKKMCTQR